MIKYNLKCHNNHEFESWFANSEEFDKLNKKNLLDCIFCSSKKINKSIMAPVISNLKSEEKKIDTINKNFEDKRDKLVLLRKYIEKNFDYVGTDFTKKVREVYYDRKNNKSFYGITTSKEREELTEEGIDLISIPWLNKEN